MATSVRDEIHTTSFHSNYPNLSFLKENVFKHENKVVFPEEYIRPKHQIHTLEIILPTILDIFLNDEFVVSIPYELRDLFREINKSKYILELIENHDNQGAIAYSNNTWKKTIIFLAEYVSLIYKESGKIVTSPKIFHGPDGSIDLQWKTNDFKLLINIPDETNIATFFGNYQNNQEVEGSFYIDNYKLHLLPSLITV